MGRGRGEKSFSFLGDNRASQVKVKAVVLDTEQQAELKSRPYAAVETEIDQDETIRLIDINSSAVENESDKLFEFSNIILSPEQLEISYYDKEPDDIMKVSLGTIDKASALVFTSGCCAALAVALEEATGRPIVGIAPKHWKRLAEGQSIPLSEYCHFGIRNSSQEVLDIKGVASNKEWLHRVQMREQAIFNVSKEKAINYGQHIAGSPWKDNKRIFERDITVARSLVPELIKLFN